MVYIFHNRNFNILQKKKMINSFEKHIEMGNNLIENDKPEIARKCFQKALSLKIENHVALDGLAWTYHMEGNDTKARQLLERSIKKNPNFAEAYTDLGCVLYELGDINQAEKMHKKCLELDPTRDDAKWNLAHLYFSVQRYEEMEKFLEKAEDILENKSEILQLLGEVKIMKKDFSKARDIFSKCLEIDEHNVEAGILLTYIELQMKEK